MLKKYWWVLLILVVIILVGYMASRQMTGSSNAPAYNYGGVTASTAPSTANSGNIYMTKTDPVKGSYLTDFNGMSLYVFDKDTSGVSNCTGSCTSLWPPYSSGATAQGSFPTGITVITRSDGTQQFAYNGKPLYYFSGDKAAGDTKGDGVNGVWHLAKP